MLPAQAGYGVWGRSPHDVTVGRPLSWPVALPAVSIEHVRTTVANIKSQKKRNLTNAKRAARNKTVKSELKTRVKTATSSIGTDTNDEDVRLAVKRLDMAASKGVIHANQAARRKRRLMAKINAGA
jgi:small subunit ribosomal protein S20